MKAGVKIGPDNWEQVLSTITPECAEVWFHLGKRKEFDRIFSTLKDKNIPFGLHFWDVLPGGYEPNLSYEKHEIAEESEKRMRETLKIAATVGASYVNVHPGSLMLKKLDLENKSMKGLPETQIGRQEALQTLVTHSLNLHNFGSSLDIDFLVETLPLHDQSHWRDESGHEHVEEVANIDIEAIVTLAQNGVMITNDFGHTLSSIASDDREELWHTLLAATKKLAPYTKLIHLNTVRVPFNGTDSHDGVLQEDFDKGVLPGREQIQTLLRIFSDRDDVWVIPEPRIEGMVANYEAIFSMLLLS